MPSTSCNVSEKCPSHGVSSTVPFTSRQLYSTAPRGFVWDASIQFLPLLPFRVRDSYQDGAGRMVGTVAGVVTVVNQQGTPGMGEASLLRYLAEAAWFPTALLPSEGVQWTAVDDRTARATLTDRNHTVTMEVYFGSGGEMARVSANRGREVNGFHWLRVRAKFPSWRISAR